MPRRDFGSQLPKSRLGDAVTFTGFVSREEMPEIYRDAVIFVLPSESEGMSIALLEAMAAGLPVVHTRTGGAEELVREGTNGYTIDWADVEGLSRVLARLVADPSARARMGSESRKIASRFSWREIAEQYRSLCGRSAGVAGQSGRADGVGRAIPL